METQWLYFLGSKFALPITKKDFPLFKNIIDGESCLQTINDKEEQEIARTKLTTHIDRHISTTREDNRDKTILNTKIPQQK